MEILGIAITGLLAFVLAFVAILKVTKLNLFGLGPAVRSMVPGKFGVILAILILFVAIGPAISFVKDKAAGLGTGSIIGEEQPNTLPGITGLTCVFNSAPSGVTGTYLTDTAASGLYTDDDPNDLSHYTVYVLHNNGTRTINGTVSCTRTGDINSAASAKCWAVADTFRSQTSTTDSNTYTWVLTNAVKSKISGVPWQQDIHLNDGSAGSASTDAEETYLAFNGGSSAEQQEDLGYFFTLPGATPWSYLNNQSAGDVKIYCDGAQVARITVQKVSA